MNKRKVLIASLINVFIGTISGFYFYFAYLLLKNIGKGESYYNKEGEALRPLGGIMFLVWIVLFIVYHLNSYKNNKNKVMTITKILFLLGGLIISIPLLT